MPRPEGRGSLLLYPGGALKEDEYYFGKKRAETDDLFSREARRLDRKRTDRRTHFFHALSKHIVSECAERGRRYARRGRPRWHPRE